MALTVNDLITRARTMLGKGTIYKLGKGGFNPTSTTAFDSQRQLDCTGFVAWCLGISRHTSNSFYANYNGDGIKGWFETTAAFKDAQHLSGFLTQINRPVRGCIVVYGDRKVNGKTQQGHIGIVTEVSEAGTATKVIHCSSSGYRNAGDAIQENNSPALLNNRDALFAVYNGIVDHRFVAGLHEAAWIDLPSDMNASLASLESSGENRVLTPVFEVIKNGNVLCQAWKVEGEKPFFFQAAAKICADGAPDAYKAGDAGRDYLRNAGKPPRRDASTTQDLHLWQWWGVVVDENNQPVVQNQQDPCPGYFVSTTAHYNAAFKHTDPKAYVNANEIPYIVLPRKKTGGARLGDYAYVLDRKTGIGCPAIYAEVGPQDAIGEISIKAAKLLSLPFNPKKGGTARKDVLYVIFPGSGNGKHRSLEEINQHAEKLFQDWGGTEKVNALLPLQESTVPEEGVA